MRCMSAADVVRSARRDSRKSEREGTDGRDTYVTGMSHGNLGLYQQNIKKFIIFLYYHIIKLIYNYNYYFIFNF